MQFPVEMIRSVLPYLRQTALFGGSSIDLSQPDAYVLPSEDIIRRISFDEVLQQHLTWIAQRVSERDKAVGVAAVAAQPQLLHQAAARTTSGRPVFRTPFEIYSPIKQIGQGGSGYVWSAKDEAGETVAIKYVDPGKLGGRRGVRFRNEVRFGQRANHPNIIRLELPKASRGRGFCCDPPT